MSLSREVEETIFQSSQLQREVSRLEHDNKFRHYPLDDRSGYAPRI
jgi:hypothetical protein